MDIWMKCATLCIMLDPFKWGSRQKVLDQMQKNETRHLPTNGYLNEKQDLAGFFHKALKRRNSYTRESRPRRISIWRRILLFGLVLVTHKALNRRNTHEALNRRNTHEALNKRSTREARSCCSPWCRSAWLHNRPSNTGSGHRTPGQQADHETMSH
jgi:hypothetical protein